MADYDSFIKKYNEISYEIDLLYTQYAASCSLSDSEIWILYLIVENDGETTQSEVCKAFSQNRKTINSAVSKLEKNGVLVKKSGEGKKVLLSLTEKGRSLAKKTVLPLMEAEKMTIKDWSQEEKNMLLLLTKKYCDDFKSRLKEMGER